MPTKPSGLRNAHRSPTESLESTKPIVDARRGYDFIALSYEEWRWSKLWRKNEAPIVVRWLRKLEPGLGLDAGSGPGPYLDAAIKLHHRCVATDISGNMLALNESKRRHESGPEPVTHVQADISSLPFADKTFDWILCSRVLSHVSNVDAVLHEFARVLKDEGECLITDVHPNHPYTNVEIPGKNGKIAISTYKHPLQATKQAISQIPQLKLLSLREYHLRDLRAKPPIFEFGKLYDPPNAPIFYVCRLRKR